MEDLADDVVVAGWRGCGVGGAEEGGLAVREGGKVGFEDEGEGGERGEGQEGAVDVGEDALEGEVFEGGFCGEGPAETGGAREVEDGGCGGGLPAALLVDEQRRGMSGLT